MSNRFTTQGSILDEEEFVAVGVMELQNDLATIFAKRARIRSESMQIYVRQDCSRRVRAAILRKASPIPGKYSQGDLVCYVRAQESQLHRTDRWSTCARVIGFEGKVVWVLHEGTLVATSLHRLRPATPSEALAYHLSSKGMKFDVPDIATAEQTIYQDERQRESEPTQQSRSKMDYLNEIKS